MPPSQPPSIFANHSSLTPKYRAATSAPATPLAQTPPPLQHTPWRLDPGDPIPPPLFTPPQSVQGRASRGATAGPQATPPAAAGTKRPTPGRPSEPASEPLHKRRRVETRARYSLDRFSVPTGAQFLVTGQPTSPLFFSSRQTRPHLPARFSSSEAAARMLSNAHGEESGSIKVVNLARGTYGLSPPGPASVPSGRSSERSSLPRTASPDARDRSDPLRLLGSIGIVELLEQDTRPTFIVDISDTANYSTDAAVLQILFANGALRSSPATWAVVAGKSPQHAPDETLVLATSHFRNWLLSSVIQAGTPDTNPLPVEHGGMIWSCYTLRKRLRVVSGAVPTHVANSITPASDPTEFPIPSTSSMGGISGNSILTMSSSVQQKEAQDYFGSTGPIAAGEQHLAHLESSQQQPDSTASAISKDVSGIFQKATDITVPSVEEDSSSSTNESVSQALRAGNVDPSGSSQIPSRGDVPFFDWTRLPLTASLPRHIQFARSIDWSATPLGPIEYWSNDLRAMCNLIM